MTASNTPESSPESREELLDLATLESLGMLDDEQSRTFWRRLDSASDAIRAEIIERQAGLAAERAFLSAEDPDPSLRSRVVGAVRAASAVRQPVQVGADAGATASGGGDAEPWRGGDEEPRPLRQLVERMRREQEIERRSRTAPWLWRAASLVLAAGLVVSVWFQARLSERVASIAELAMQRQTEDQLRALIGPGLDRFLAGRCEVIGLAGASAEARGAASLLIDPSLEDGFLVVQGLPAIEGGYVLRGIDESGATSVILEFQPVGAVGGYRVPAERLAVMPGRRFEVADSTGRVILRSA